MDEGEIWMDEGEIWMNEWTLVLWTGMELFGQIR